MKKVVIFDLDGVVVESTDHVSNFFRTTYPTLTKEHMNEMLTGNFPTEMEKLKKTHSAIDETEEQGKLRGVEYSRKKAELPLYDGMRELLQSLHDAGHILVINTSALERNTLPFLEKSGISKLFDFIATKETSVDKTEKLKLISQTYSIPVDQMVFITDTLGDIREADKAGVPTIAVTYGAHDRSFFEREHHTSLIQIVDTVEELRSFLLSLLK